MTDNRKSEIVNGKSPGHFPPDQDVRYSRIFAGAAWPALRPGFLVVVGEDRRARVGGQPVLRVLDEASDALLYHLVQKCSGMAFFYKPERFYADCAHVAAMQFAAEFADRDVEPRPCPRGSGAGPVMRTGLRLEHSPLCAMKAGFAYSFPVLARLLEVKRLEVPANSELNGELLAVRGREEIDKLRLSDYPAIAALSFAVVGLEGTREDWEKPRATELELPKRILE